jgi:hypothetical protein
MPGHSLLLIAATAAILFVAGMARGVTGIGVRRSWRGSEKMAAAFRDVRLLSLLLLLDLSCLSVAVANYRAASAIEPYSRCERRPDIRTPSLREATAMLDDMRLHD